MVILLGIAAPQHPEGVIIVIEAVFMPLNAACQFNVCLRATAERLKRGEICNSC
jgi:hypothetical protein